MALSVFVTIIINATALAQTPVPAENVAARATMTSITWLGLAYASPALANRCREIINCGNGASDLAKCYANIGALGTSAQVGAKTLLGNKSREYLVDYTSKVGKDPSTLAHLKYLNGLLDRKDVNFNLWNVTLQSRHFKGNKEKAFEFLATLFQDFDTTLSHLPEETEKIRKEVAQKLVKRIRDKSVQGYPKGVDINKTSIYHFYSIGLMASDMSRRGVPTRYAASLPFSLNEGYENIGRTRANDKDYRDIYAGYAGVQFALSSDKEEFTGVQYKAFQDQYHSDGGPAVSRFFKDGLGGKEMFCNDTIDWETYRKKGPTLAPSSLQESSAIK